MSKIVTSIKRLIGRVKQHMGAILLTVGGVLMPFGFFLAVERPALEIIGLGFVVLGVVFWFLSYQFTRTEKHDNEWKREQREEWEDKNWEVIQSLLSKIYREIHELNQRKKNDL